MSLTFQKAQLSDLDLLVQTRLTVLRAANKLPSDTPLPQVEAQSRAYYTDALADGSHTAYLVFDGDRWIGAGGISYFRVMPTVDNPTGRKGYYMNLYVAPEYRRQGICTKLLDLLTADAHARGATFLTLEATAMGRPVYERYGFRAMEHEMILQEDI